MTPDYWTGHLHNARWNMDSGVMLSKRGNVFTIQKDI